MKDFFGHLLFFRIRQLSSSEDHLPDDLLDFLITAVPGIIDLAQNLLLEPALCLVIMLHIRHF